MKLVLVLMVTALMMPTMFQTARGQTGIPVPRSALPGREPLNQMYEFNRSQSVRSTYADSFRVLGRWAWGDCYAVAESSNYAYIGNGVSILILDISTPSSPLLVSQYVTDGTIVDIHVRDSLLFVGTGNGLVILDVSAPNIPRLVSSLPIPCGSGKIAVEDSLVYSLTGCPAIQIVDVSNPASPVLRGSAPTSADILMAIAVKDRYVYVGSYNGGGIDVIDATNPDNPSYLYTELGGRSMSAVCRDTLLLLGTSDSTDHIDVFSVSSPSSLVRLGSVTLGSYGMIGPIRSLDVDSGKLYCGTVSHSVYSVDLSTPNAPRVLTAISTSRFILDAILSLSVYRDHIYAAAWTGLWIIDASQPDSLIEKTYFPTGGDPNKMAISGRVGYLASNRNTLWTLDLSDLSNPRGITNVNVGGGSSDIVVANQKAYIAVARGTPDTAGGLWIFDVANPVNPSIIGHLKSNALSVEIAKQGDLLLMAQAIGVHDSVLEIIDVSTPSHPNLLSVFENPCLPYHIAVRDSFAFLASYSCGLQIIDFHDPLHPVQVSQILSSALGVAVRDSFAYVARGDSFFVINVSTPNGPVVWGACYMSAAATSDVDISVSGNYAYWTDGALASIDISDPTHPTQTALFDAGRGTGVTAVGDTVYGASVDGSLWILQHPPQPTCTTCTMNSGWYLVSVPRLVSNYKRATLFPTSVSGAYAYKHGYVSTDSLAVGSGYWIKSLGPPPIVNSGDSLLLDTVSVELGWNLIGSLTKPLDASSVVSVPSDLVQSNYYGYNNGYVIAQFIEPGQGYWVKTSQAGRLILGARGTLDRTSKRGSLDLESLDSLKIEDNFHRQRVLYFGTKEIDPQTIAQCELPPKPPEGVFDIRFLSQGFVSVLKGDNVDQDSRAIQIQGVAYPLLFHWNLGAEAGYRLTVTPEGGISQEYSLRGHDSLRIFHPCEYALSLKPSAPAGRSRIPSSISIRQNYPNPFNPQTTIEFGLGESGVVTVTLLNLLGQEVEEVFRGHLDAGDHRVSLNGANLPSGVYFLRVATSKASAITRLIVVR